MSEPDGHTEAPATAPSVDGTASAPPAALSLVVTVSVFCVVVWGLWLLFGGGPGRAPRPEE